MAVMEIRVHGVGGAPGHRQLGLRDAEDAVVVVGPGDDDGDLLTRVLARRDDPSVRSYEWGDLTSGSPLHALWILLLPYTLLNAAGWMHPRRSDRYPGQIGAQRALVAALGFVLTAWFALWTIEIVVGLLGYQWARQAIGRDGVEVPLTGWHLDAAGARTLSVAISALVVLGVVAGLAVLARSTRRTACDPGRQGTPDAAADATSGGSSMAEVGLADREFFERRTPWYGGLVAHCTVAALVAVAAGVLIGRELGETPAPRRLDIDVLFDGLSLATLVLLAVLALVNCLLPALWVRVGGGRSRRGAERATGRATAAVILAFFVGIAFAGGLNLWLVRVLDAGLVLGPQARLTEAFVVTLGFWGLGAVALVIRWWRSRSLQPDEGGERDPVSGRWRVRAARQEELARMARHADRYGMWAAAIAVAVTAIVVTPGLDDDAPASDSALNGLASWVLVALIAWYVLQVQSLGKATRFGRLIGQVWDVLTFWPRRFHPLAIRPYAQRAVPELRQLVRDAAPGGVVVSAHSQGSVLAYAALAPLVGTDEATTIGLVTYGSPLGCLEHRAFPAYCNPEGYEELRSGLGGGWHSFNRRTDPIGGPVLTRDGQPTEWDHCLADPATADPMPRPTPTPTDGSPPPCRCAVVEHEPIRQANVDLAIHSHYLCEAQVQDQVRLSKDRVAERAG